MKVLLIEDEPLAQAELKRLLALHFPHIEVVEMLGSVLESITWLKKQQPELIFMDIQLADGLSFEIFEQVEIHVPVIFVTAYDEYAIRAFQANGIGYLLKPIDEQELVQAVERLQHHPLYAPERLQALSQTLVEPQQEYKQRIMVRAGDRFHFLDMAQIAYFYTEERITFAITHEGERRMVDYTLEALEPLLDPKQFFRLTRGCIASINAILEVHKYFNSRLKIVLNPPYTEEVLVSRVRVSAFLQWLDGQ